MLGFSVVSATEASVLTAFEIYVFGPDAGAIVPVPSFLS